MAKATDFKLRVTKIVTCPICLDDFTNSKMLPCVHSFCLKCLQNNCRNEKNGDDVPCPVCRKNFRIPDSGLDALPHNFFLENLIDERDALSQKAEEVCEVCVAAENDEDENEGEIPSATVYCVDCNQKLCRRCSRSCRSKTRGGPHQVIPLGAELTAELLQQRGSYCDQHRDERIKLYCHDCEINVCLMCFAVNHTGHKCADVGKAAGEFIEQFESHIKSVSSRIDDIHVAVAQVDAENTKFMSAMDEQISLIQQRGKAVNEITETHVDRLLQELRIVKSDGVTEANNRSEELELALTSLESFKNYVAELMAKGSTCDITREAKTMRCRAIELLQTYAVPSDYHSPCDSFTPMNIDEFTNEEQNLIGRICQQTDRSGISVFYFKFGIRSAVKTTVLIVSYLALYFKLQSVLSAKNGKLEGAGESACLRQVNFYRPPFRKNLRGHVRTVTVPGNMHVKFEVRSFNVLELLASNPQKFRGSRHVLVQRHITKLNADC